MAVWVTEDLPTLPRDFYDITRIATEGLYCDFFSPILQTTVLRVSRFWDEPLEKKVFYRMYRGVNVRDVAAAHRPALRHHFDAFGLFNISARPAFKKEYLHDLRNNTLHILKNVYPR
jgi:nucleoside-diphosphate-sugar epimerase